MTSEKNNEQPEQNQEEKKKLEETKEKPVTKEIPLKDIILSQILTYRQDVGNLDDITGEIFTSIIVRVSETNPGKFELIAGYRRLKKAEKEKKEKIRCDVYLNMSDANAILTNLRENLQRKTPNLIEEGQAYENALTRMKITQEQLAKLLTEGGKKTSQERISNTIRLLKLAKTVQDYLALNKLGVYKGLLLLRVVDDKAQIDLANDFVKHNCTDEEAKKRIEQFKEQLTTNKARGQTMFHFDGKHYSPSPEIIHPALNKIKLRLKEPFCSRVVEMINEGEKLQCKNSETCPTCPLEGLCAMFVKYHDELEKNNNK